MGSMEFLLLLCIACSCDISTAESLSELSSVLANGSPPITSDSSSLSRSNIEVSHQNSAYIATKKELASFKFSSLSESDPTHRPIINSQYVAEDCASWVNPTESSDIPSGFTKIPAVISFSSVAINDTFSLAIVDKYGEQLACFMANAQDPESLVSVFLGQCGSSEPVVEEVWPHLLEPNHDNWPCLVKPHFSLSDYFHIEVGAQEKVHGDETTRVVSFRPNGNVQKELSVTVNASAEFVYIFAAKIKTAVNVVYFRDGYTASNCQTLDEPVKWNQEVYFHPDEDATQVKIYISYCYITEVLTYSVNPQTPYWHKLSFNEDQSVNSQENVYFYRNLLINDMIVGNITFTKDPLHLRLQKVCPLKVARVSMKNAIWSDKCNISDIAKGRNLMTFDNLSSLLTDIPLPDLKNRSLTIEKSKPCKTLHSQDTPTPRPAINPDYVAKDCSNWINPKEYSDMPSAFTRIPSVISVSGFSTNDSFSLSIVDKYGKQLACFVANAQYSEAHVFIYSGKCHQGDPILEEVWPHMMLPNHDNWPCLVKPHFRLFSYFHIEVSAEEKMQGNGTIEVSFRPNGESHRALSVTTDSSAEFVYIFATKIKTAVNMVYFRDGYTASKCQTLDEPLRWNQEAYFRPEDGATQVKIYFSYCHFTETLIYPVDPTGSMISKWHKLSFSEDPSEGLKENIFFYRNILVDDLIVGNITSTMDHPPILLRLMKVCPLRKVRVSMINAIWTNKCNPSNLV